MDKKNNVLGLLAVIFGGAGLLFSWLPWIGMFGVFLAVVGLILGLIGLLLKNRKKVLAIVGSVLSALAIVIGFSITASATNAVVDSVNESQASQSAAESKQSKVEYIVTSAEKKFSVQYSDKADTLDIGTNDKSTNGTWEKSATLTGSGIVRVSANSDTYSGAMTCVIKVDGVEVDKAEGNGSVSCDADLSKP